MPKAIKCEICGYITSRENYKKRAFMARFPINENRCRQWVKLTGKEDLAHVPIEKLHELKYVCEKHFRQKDFQKKKTQLRKNAVPSLGLTAEPLTDEVLKRFPLHVAKNGENQDSFLDAEPSRTQCLNNAVLTQISDEHNYCNSNVIKANFFTQIANEHNYCNSNISETRPSALTQNLSLVLETNVKRKKSRSPNPSASNQNSSLALETNLKRKRSCSPKLSALTQNNEIDSPRKKKMRKKIQTNKIKIKKLQKQVDDIKKLDSPLLKSLISAFITNKNRKPQGKRWTTLNKSIALALYKKSPKAYRYIHQLLPMPSVRTLQTILQNIKMDPGVYPTVMSHLKKEAVNMAEKDKLCVVMFDEIALKKRLIYNIASDKIDGYVDIGDVSGRSQDIADHALVLMIQGIHTKFKQPIAHYLVKGTISKEKLAVIIKNAIQAVRDAGYYVICTVCDQGPTNVGALNLLKRFCGNHDDSNSFLINNEKVFIVYDVPHLFKSIRNNFLSGGILVMGNKKAKWAHLIELEKENKRTLHFQKITKLHVEPKFRSKMRVKLAAQILSNTVAAVLKLLSQSTHMKENSREILETAEIIEDLDQLFDCTNGPSSPQDIKKNIRENVRQNSFHHKLWIKFKKNLKTLHFLKSDSFLRLKNIRCVNGYIITLTSLQDIWKYVESKGFKYLNLRQLNQDSLENLFGIIRQHSPTNKNPTCHHFQSALKSAVLTRLNTPRSRGTNCESDGNEILFDFHDIVFKVSDKMQIKSVHENQLVPSDQPVLYNDNIYEDTESDEQMVELLKTFDNQPTVYVSGYLAMAILKGHKCQECIKNLTVSNPEPNSIYDYIALREWWSDKSSLTYPTIQLCRTVDQATKIFEREARPQLFCENIAEYCVTIMMTWCNISWMCEEHRSIMSERLLRRLSHLLIRNDCRILNRTLAVTEEKAADLDKIKQQQAKAK